jgi:5-methylcytosine-specific restriction enzyme A
MTAWEGSHSQGFTRWQRAAILRRDPVCKCAGCKHCTTTGCTSPSTQADHITPVAEHGSNHTANGQGLCTPCHSVKTAAETARGAARARAQRPRQRPPERHPGLR